jgi:hypothetical protein
LKEIPLYTYPLRNMSNDVLTITFGDVCENHVGMEKIGVPRPDIGAAITPDHLKVLYTQYTELGYKVELIDLSAPNHPAAILVIRGMCTHTEALRNELSGLDWDTMALMRGKVVNKRARHNLCFSDHSSEPNYAEGKGRVINFNTLPVLSHYRAVASSILYNTCTLQGEGNRYYDTSKCYIGFHGDTERNIVVGLRVGGPFPLHYRWYQNSEPISQILSIPLNDGDMYVMSYKAIGTDWKKKLIPTLRHAAGYNLPK